jgi:hypothetical protein
MHKSLKERIGDQVSDADWNTLIDWIRRLRVIASDLTILIDDLHSQYPDDDQSQEEDA